MAYYEKVLKRLKATGRFQFFPQCEYKGDRKFVSKVDSQLEYEIEVRKKTVDATYLTTNVPSTTKPQFHVGEGANVVPINHLARLTVVRLPEPWNYLLSFNINFKKSFKVTPSLRVPRVRGGDPSGVAPGKV